MQQLRARNRAGDVQPDYVKKLKKIVKARQNNGAGNNLQKSEPANSSMCSTVKTTSPRIVNKVSMFDTNLIHPELTETPMNYKTFQESGLRIDNPFKSAIQQS